MRVYLLASNPLPSPHKPGLSIYHLADVEDIVNLMQKYSLGVVDCYCVLSNVGVFGKG